MPQIAAQLLPILSHWVTFLSHALPPRSVPTFVELLFGAMLSEHGWVTEAWQTVSMQRHWSTYYKWLEEGKWSWVRLGQYLATLVFCSFKPRVWYLVVDDTTTCRASKKAPGAAKQHNHGKKANRPEFLWGQCWVMLAAVVGMGRGRCQAIPLLAWLQRVAGNRNKLDAARVLLRVVGIIFRDVQVRVLLDAWYMRRRLIQYIISEWDFGVIGQVRRDTAFYALPEEQEGPGRPRKYGQKYTPEQVNALPMRRVRLWLYGKWQLVRYRSVQAKARFLQGRIVRVVWVQFEAEDGTLSETRVILATEINLRPEVILKAYARRWAIEPMFNQLRHGWGWKDAWQQSRQVLARWVQILLVGYALVQLLVLKGAHRMTSLMWLTPWRRNRPITAGIVRLSLRRILAHVDLRACWNPKSRKFQLPDTPN